MPIPTPAVAPTATPRPVVFGTSEVSLLSVLLVNEHVFQGEERTFSVKIQPSEQETQKRKASVDLGGLRNAVSYTLKRSSGEVVERDTILEIKGNDREILEVIVKVAEGARANTCSDIYFRSETEAKVLVENLLIAQNFCVKNTFSWSMSFKRREGSELVFLASITNDFSVRQTVTFEVGRCNFTKTAVKYLRGKTELLLADRTQIIGSGNSLSLEIRVTPRAGTVPEFPACNLDLNRR